MGATWGRGTQRWSAAERVLAGGPDAAARSACRLPSGFGPTRRFAQRRGPPSESLACGLSEAARPRHMCKRNRAEFGASGSDGGGWDPACAPVRGAATTVSLTRVRVLPRPTERVWRVEIMQILHV